MALPRTTRLAAALALAVPFLAGPTGAAPARDEERTVARGGRDGASLVALAAGDRIVVRDGDRQIDAPVAAGTRVRAIERVGRGWLLAGTAPTADGGSEIALTRGDESGTAPVAPPAGRRGKLRHGPVALADDATLAGLAWLEGDDRRGFEVRHATWNGSGFDAPTVVAPRGPGSQLALAGARLADGRTLLVWAGFDGSDDEIWASLGDGASWSTPIRIGGDNRVPDITPAVVAAGDGALVAWSRFDGGEYRVVVARFDGARFTAAQPAGELGTMFPSFERDGGRLGLLFRDAGRGGWALREIDDGGRLGRLGRLALLAGDERPLVRLSERGVEWSDAELHEATAWE